MAMLEVLMGEALSGVLGIAIGSSGVVGVSFCVKTGFCMDTATALEALPCPCGDICGLL